MKSYDLVRQINKIIGHIDPSKIPDKVLTQLSDAYTTVSKQFNERVFQCKYLLQNDNSAAAKDLAQASPDLLEEFQTLKMMDHQAWQTLCAGRSILLAEVFNAEEAQRVIPLVFRHTNDLESLLNEYRRRSLELGGLAERVHLIRELCRKDMNDETWAKDQAIFEKALLRELEQEISEAQRNGEQGQLERILGELKRDEWVVLPPKETITRVENCILALKKAAINHEFDETAADLEQAFAIKDEQACQSLADRISHVSRESGFSPPEKMLELLATVEAWLRKENAYRQACDELIAALDNRESPASLERIEAKIINLGREVPEPSQKRLDHRRKETAQTIARRRRWRVAGAFAATVFFFFAFRYIWAERIYQQDVDQWRQRISQNMQRKELEGAGNLLELLAHDNPKVFQSPEIQEVRQQYLKAIYPEQERKKQLQASLASLEKMGVANLSEADLARAEVLVRTAEEKSAVEEWRRRITQAALEQQKKTEQQREAERQARFNMALAFLEKSKMEVLEEVDVQRLEKLAQSRAEKDQVDEWRRKIRQFGLEQQKKAEQQREAERRARFQMAVAFLEKSKIEVLSEADIQKVQQLAQTDQEKDQAALWRRRREQYLAEATMQKNQQYETELQHLEADCARLRDGCEQERPLPELEKIASRCTMSADKLLTVIDVPSALTQRTRVVREAVGKLITSARDNARTATQVRSQIDEISKCFHQPDVYAASLKTFIKQFPSHTLSADFRKVLALESQWKALAVWRDLLKKYRPSLLIRDKAAAMARGREVSEFIVKFPEYPYITDILDYLKYLDGIKGSDIADFAQLDLPFDRRILSPSFTLETFSGKSYFLPSDTVKETTEQFRKYVVFQYVRDTDASLRFRRLPEQDIRQWPSPSMHLLFLKRYDEWRHDPKMGDIHTFYLKAAESLRADPSLNPWLRAIFIKVLLSAATGYVPEAFVDQVRLSSTPLDTLNVKVRWMDPDDEDANRLRPVVVQALETLPSWVPLIQQITKYKETLAVRLNMSYDPIAVLLDHNPKPGLPPGISSGDGFVLLAGTSTDRLVKVCTIQNSQVQITDAKILDSCPRGSLLYSRVIPER